MWELIEGVTSGIRRPARRVSRINVLPAMLLGAGVGIAAWEIAKRRNGQATSMAETSGQVGKAISDAIS